MMRRFAPIVAILALAIAETASAGQQTRNVLSPTQVSPPPVGPTSTTLPFGVAWPVACPCTLTVVNGSASSGPLSPTRVTAGWVWVDGTLRISPLQLNALTSGATTTVNLAAGTHQVRVQVAGSSTSYVTVRVSGTITTANLATARANHTATLMPGGGVLIAGGDGAAGELSSVERVNASASAVAASAPLLTARRGHSATLVPGGSALIAGGRDASGNIADVELLTATGSTLALPLDEVRRAHTSTTLLDGRVLILGGRTTADVPTASGVIVDPRPDPFTDDQYNPSSASATSLGDVLQVARAGHTATLLADGRVLIVGGRGASGDLSSIELFDPALETSTLLPFSLATPRSNHTATLRPNGNVIVTGGRHGNAFLSSIERVRPAQNDVNAAGSLSLARAGHTATVIRNGEILIAGGSTASGLTRNTELALSATDDTLAPAIVAVTPGDEATDVDRGIVIGLHASEPLEPSSVSTLTVSLKNPSNVVVPASIGISDQATLIAIRPDARLSGGDYSVTLTGATDRAGNVLPPFSITFTVVAAPSIASITPVQGPAGTTITVNGSGLGATAADHQLSFGSTIVPVTPVSATELTFAAPSMPVGDYAISLRTRGGVASSPTSFTIVTPAPALTSIAPTHVAAGSGPFTLSLTGTNFVDGATVAFGATTLTATYLSSTSLEASVPGSLVMSAGSVNVHVANPGGGTSNDVVFTVDSVGPTLTALSIFPRGQSLSVGATQSFTAEARYSDGAVVNVTNTGSWLSSSPSVVTVDAGGQTSAASAGNSTITVSFGGQSASADVVVSTGEAIPPDPADVAPDLNPTESTTTADATRFLYEGENPIQRGVTPGAIQIRQAAVIKGVAKTRDDQPLSGVHVSVKDRPDLGHTLTRLDGAFDMAVNGGGSLVVQFTKAGFLPVDRREVVPAGDFESIPEVVLIGLDPQVTNIDLNSATPIQVARGSVVTDAAGSRQATVLVPQGTTAEMHLPDGTTQSLTSMHVRATEYTVGENGPAAMPASLPLASAYTHAVELSVDEAVAAGAKSVQFNAPLPVYYENFLGFPIGAAVPVGYYDRDLAAWVPSDNGVVLKILSIDGAGRAELDIDGDATVDPPATLTAFGITDAERTSLAGTYSTGQSLWRVQARHFTTFDHNWPRKFPDDAQLFPKGVQAPRGGNEKVKTPSKCNGSIIECQDQVLGESLAVTGTPFSINYRSDRAPGYVAGDSVQISLTEATVPPSLLRIDLTIRIAGQVHTQSFTPSPGLTTEFTWNRRDGYGRPVHGTRTAAIAIQHVYPIYYTPRPFATRPFSFGQYNVTEVAPNMFLVPGRELWSVPIRFTVELGPPPQASPSVGGWSLSPHHVYDPAERTLFYGNGNKRVTGAEFLAPPVEALNVPPYEYFNAVVAKTGIYFIDFDGQRKVYRQVGAAAPEAIATLDREHTIAVDDDGVVYYAYCTNGNFTPGGVSINRLTSSGWELVASADPVSGGNCHESSLNLVHAPDGTFYLSDGESLFQLSTDGVLEHVKTFPTFAYSIAVGPDGAVYRNADGAEGGIVIERLSPSGTVTRVAGSGAEGTSGDGGHALDASFEFIYDFAVGADGSLFLTDFGDDDFIRLRRVWPDGFIRTFAAGAIDSGVLVPNGTPASALGYIQHVDVGPDGWVYAFGHHGYRFAPDFDRGTPIKIASEDGSEVYEFTPAGRHLRTVNALTGTDRYTFAYDPAGRLTAITDGDGLVTEIQRNGAGAPTAIVAPFGQTTGITTTSDGWLSTLVAPGSRTTTLTMTSSGMLTELRDPRNELHTFVYDTKGRLIRDEDPAGGTQTLGRTALADGWTATRTTAMDRVTAYRTETLDANGSQQLTVTAPDGTSTVSTVYEDGSRETLAADGTQTTFTVTADPRFGLQVPIVASSTVTTPGGVTMSAQMERYVDFADPADFSTLYQWDYATINGRTYETIYEGATRTFTTTSPTGRVTRSTIDAQGRITSTQVGSLTPVTFTYDAQGRLTTTTQGSRQSTITYDPSGRTSVLTDPLTRTVSFGYDTADRVTTQTLPDTRVIGFGYDASDNVTSLTPPSRPAHTFSYTPIDFSSSYTPPMVPGTGSTEYLFNVDRQPTEVQRPDGLTTLFAYGASNGRLTGTTFSRGQLTHGYDAAGRLSTLADPGGVNLAFAYDGSLPTSETWSGQIEGMVSRTFTNNFELATERINDAFEVAFSYDNDRLLTAAGALTITRHPENGLVTATAVGNTTEAHEYNEFGEPSRQTATVNGSQVFDVQTSRDTLGRVAQRIEAVDGITRVFQYGYDLAGRLESVTRNGDLVVHYVYDANGNRLSAEGEAGLFTGAYDDQDRLLTYGGASYTYNANGELATKTASGQTTSYDYDTLGNLIRVTKPNGDVITYAIDGRSRRVGKSINGTRVKAWLYADHLRPIAELDGNGDVVSRFVYGTRANVPEYIINGGTTYRVFSDHIGSPRIVVDTTTGAVVQRMDFQAFGEIIQDSNPGWQPFGFAGGMYDADSQLIRFGARDYSPQLGRWVAKDPIGFSSGDTQFYAYVANDPVNLTDPSGYIPFDTLWDLGNVIYDLATGNYCDLVADLVSMAIPYVPAGTTKLGKLAAKNPPFSRGGPPRAPNGDYLPHPDANGRAHTTLGTHQGRNDTYTQGATFDENGKFLGRTDVTDHGRPGQHTNPHWHPATSPNSTGGAQPVPKGQ